MRKIYTKTFVYFAEIQYIYKENGGMHTAHNKAYENIHTELNVCIDSDDKMAPGSVGKIQWAWEKVREKDYAGLIALDADFSGTIIGKGFPDGMKDTTLGGYYAAEPGTNCDFILKHSVGNKPKKKEVDVPLTYADYYYVEALLRYKKDILKDKIGIEIKK